MHLARKAPLVDNPVCCTIIYVIFDIFGKIGTMTVLIVHC